MIDAPPGSRRGGGGQTRAGLAPKKGPLSPEGSYWSPSGLRGRVRGPYPPLPGAGLAAEGAAEEDPRGRRGPQMRRVRGGGLRDRADRLADDRAHGRGRSPTSSTTSR